MVEIGLGDLDRADVLALLQAHADLMLELSPPGSCHFFTADGLKEPEVTFWDLREAGELLGCGALKDMDGVEGEIKSMHVRSDQRGKGLSRLMLEHVLKVAMDRDYCCLSLETGVQEGFKPARTLYERYGFRVCGPFGDYVKDPNSVFMRLELNNSGLPLKETTLVTPSDG